LNIHVATRNYEAWLGEQMPLLRADLALKHRAMRENALRFLRGTFYRWAQVFPEVCEPLMSTPRVLGIGDLHVENFGTWRDIEGRLIWGINDFDEVCRLPYTVDLVRLAASAHLGIEEGHLSLAKPGACKAILDGYIAALHAGGKPFVLAEHHPALRQAAVERLKEPEKFWQKLHSFRDVRQPPPSSALKGLRRMLPEKGLDCRMCHRIAGTGSLGRRRYLALAEWRGGSIAREAKELTISAWCWARSSKSRIFYEEILERAIRVRDPFVRVRGRWIIRRLAPDCSRIELSSLPARHDAVRLLHAMGWETANVHLGSVKAAVLLKDVLLRPSTWLHSAAQQMVESTLEDWRDWCKRG
jgi:Uncharacterized protein conserved in bacteria (DUF2252)